MRRILVLVMLSCTAGVLSAQSPTPVPATPEPTPATATEVAPAAAPAEDPAHGELRALRDGLLEAMNKGDIERELTFLHPNVVVTWHDASVSRGRDGVRAYLDRMLSGPNKVVQSYRGDVNVDELTILYGGDTGISFGSAVEHFQLTSGRTLDLPARWSATVVKENGQWLIASLHCSDNLFDNPMLAAAKKMAAIGVGVASVLALAIGFFLGRRRRA